MQFLFDLVFRFVCFLLPMATSPVPCERGNVQEAQDALQQPFHFLAKSGQSTVYTSEDGRYVLKFFNNVPKPWIPFEGYRRRKLTKLKRDLAAYVLAFDRLQEECALIFLHFDVQTETDFSVLIEGRRVSISRRPFALQKRGVLMQEQIEIAGKEAVLQAVTSLVQKRAEKGVGDDDPRLQQNIGFIDGRPFFLDPGRFVEDPEKKSALPDKFLVWLKNS